jgi:hypothetical protein
MVAYQEVPRAAACLSTSSSYALQGVELYFQMRPSESRRGCVTERVLRPARGRGRVPELEDLPFLKPAKSG